MSEHWISLSLLVVALYAVCGTHAAPQSALLEIVGERMLHYDLMKEEDSKFVADPSANTDGIIIIII